MLDAADEKNREGSTIPLRADLAADLREWLADKATASGSRQSACRRFDSTRNTRNGGKRNQGDSTGPEGQSCLPLTRLPADTPLFTVPAGLVRILDRTLPRIARRVKLPASEDRQADERGRTVDVHAMRHTFGTLLSKGGVAPRTAQAAMRHSTIDLTMNIYTDPKLLDVAGAMESLPALPLGAGPQAGSRRPKCNGHRRFDPFASLHQCLHQLPANRAYCSQFWTRLQAQAEKAREAEAVAASAYPVKRKDPLTTAVNGLRQVERRRVEPPTSALRTQRSPN